MASYELVFKKSVAKDLRGLPKRDVARIMQRIASLASDPRPPGCEKLSGLDRYRIIKACIESSTRSKTRGSSS